jgi:hypothetical protein
MLKHNIGLMLVLSATKERTLQSEVGRGATLQAGRSRVRIPTRSLDFFFNFRNPSSRTMTLGLTLTEMSIRNLPSPGGGCAAGA